MPRTAVAVLYAGEDFDQLVELRTAYEVAAEQAATLNRGSVLASDVPDVEGARAAYLAFVDEAAERATEVKVSDIGARRWRELVAQHPPRSSVQYDEMVGYNTETFGAALLKYADDERRTIAEPAFDKKSERDDWLDDMPLADFEAILSQALAVNRGQVADPKDVRSSSAPDNSGATSS